ncbi:MAG: MerR family DNA-binding transcriptional regulator [Candidatus Heimdallarchaeota archaeon]|nr:MerR family DNA-binding transcriptional regulator [Candidatus Heimdallarchaeota archaeon]MCK4877820.1 MerR family DNA-binding transcriptional regulator [Candidatus Heimdallarchaeota archaeon]
MLVRIGIAAQVKGVSSSTLRRWEKEEVMRPAGRTSTFLLVLQIL